MDSYRTVLQEASDSFVEKKSRFIGYCKPVSAEEEALEFIKEIKTKHWDATHNVYAYIIKDGGIMRFSDDGEPQGTAGMPVLDVLQKSNIVDTVVVVTRYFGGILLGGGGLVRAYSHSASIAVTAAQIVTMCKCLKMSLRCDYSRYSKAEGLICENGGVLDDTVFDDAVTMHFHIVPENLENLTRNIADLTNGQGIFKEEGDGFYGMSV